MLLTTPIWLFALAAVSIPIIIHLWNIKPGKTLKVGSISLFTASSPASSRSFKLLDILLLLLRCSLLVILAFLLAAPLWQQHVKATQAKGWLLLPRNDFKEAYQKFKPKIDSLTKAGYEFHLFETGFAKRDIKEFKADTVKKPDNLNYWALLKQLAGKVSSATPIQLFTPNTLTHFKGDKPATNLNIKWRTYTPADSVASWPASAWLMTDGNIKVLQGSSTPSGTNYRYEDVKGGSSQIMVDNGRPFVNYNNIKIPVDTAINRIAIYTDKASVDANYLKAALQAIQQLTGRNTIIKLFNNANAIPANQSWIYWLSEKPVNTATIAKTKNLFAYKAGKVADVNSWLNNSEPYTINQGQSKVALYKTINTKATGNAVWTDGFGNSVLTREQNSTIIYHFYSRFNPTWNDLVWSDEFPKWLLELTQSAIQNIGTNERRILSDAQLQPTFIADNSKTQIQPTNYTDLTHYLWLALVLLFITERWLATKNKTVIVNG